MAKKTNYIVTRLKFLEKEIERLRKYLEEPQKKKAIKLGAS